MLSLIKQSLAMMVSGEGEDVPELCGLLPLFFLQEVE
jgi:hypothetical protein